jgi:hypothetical protein
VLSTVPRIRMISPKRFRFGPHQQLESLWPGLQGCGLLRVQRDGPPGRRELSSPRLAHARSELVELGAAEQGLPVPSVRAIFEEGEPIFEGSLIVTCSHVQIAIRDVSIATGDRRSHMVKLQDPNGCLLGDGSRRPQARA